MDTYNLEIARRHLAKMEQEVTIIKFCDFCADRVMMILIAEDSICETYRCPTCKNKYTFNVR